MLVTPISNKAQVYTQKLFRQNNAEKSCNTKLQCDTFTPSLSFKADIHTYAGNGYLEDLKEEVERGVDINLKNRDGYTPLHFACYYNREEVVKYLLEQEGIDINVQNSSGGTPLHMALDDGKDCIVKPLLERDDINLTLKNNNRRTPLDLAEYRCYQSKSWYEELKERTEYQLAHPETIGKSALKKPPIDISKLTPEENIWTKEEITRHFIKLLSKADNQGLVEAGRMLNKTPLIDLDADDKKALRLVGLKGKDYPEFMEQVFDYKFHKQEQLQKDYDIKREEFLERTIKTLSYEELKNNTVALNTTDGFKVLMAHPEFNPNEAIDGITLFEKACELDPEGELAKEILSKYDDVITDRAQRIKNATIARLIEDYLTTDKFRIKLRKIMENAMNEETRSVAAQKLMELLQSDDFKPEIADEFGNTVLHIAAALPDDSSRTLIQKALDKGVNKDGGNIAGQTPLMSAIKSLITTRDEAGKRNVMANIKFLLDKDVDINAQDNNGQTAFHFACLGTVAALLTLMLSKNPNVFLLDKQGNRAAKYLKTPEMKEIYNNYLGLV